MLLWDSSILLIIPAVIAAAIAQWKVRSAMNKWSEVRAQSGMTGAEAARYLLREGMSRLDTGGPELSDVGIQRSQGMLSDHYNPKDKTLNLSPQIHDGRSVAALAIAAHETGHAFQHATNYKALAVRSVLVPAASASHLTWFLFIIGLFAHSPWLQNIAIWIFAAATLFTFVTLPVEYNASTRARNMLEDSGIIAADEMKGVKAVLGAAALTYVAAALMAALQLARMLILRRE